MSSGDGSGQQSSEAPAAPASAASTAPQQPHNVNTPMLNTLLSGNSSTMPPPAHIQQSQDHGFASPSDSRERFGTGGAPAMGKHHQVTGLQQDWQPRSPAQGGQDGSSGGPPPTGMPQPQPGYPPGPGYLPPHFMHGRPPPGAGYPGGYPPPGPGFPHPSQGFSPGYPGMAPMRPMGQVMPGQPGDMVRMPGGPNPMEWAAQNQKRIEGNPATPSANALPAPSPSASSIADDSLDDKSRMDSPSWTSHGQRTPVPAGPMHPGAGGPPPMGMHPGMMTPQPAMPPRNSIVDKLVGPPTAANPPRVMPERRAFFERLVAFNEQQGDPITTVPQVSKQNVDLHRLYIAVRNRGGFEQVTRDKTWKTICSEANPDISESSAAGYQLRKHYQKCLLMLECMETNKNPDEAVAFADKLKRQRKKDASAPPTAFPALKKKKDTTPAIGRIDGSIPSGSGLSSTSGQCPPHQSSTTRVAATATWYPQHPAQGSGYLSTSQRPSPQPPMHPPHAMYQNPSTSGYPPQQHQQPQLPPRLSPTPGVSAYAQYALNFYKEHHRNREAYLRSCGMMPPQSVPEWRYGGYPPPQYGGAPGTPGGPPGPPTAGYPPGHPEFYQQQAGTPGGPPPGGPYGPPGPGYPGGSGYPPPGAYPGALPPGATSIRAPHPQQHMTPQGMTPGHPDISNMDEQQKRQYMMQQQQHHQMMMQQHMQQQQQGQSGAAASSSTSLTVPSASLAGQPATPGQPGPGSVQPATPALQADTAGSQAGSRAPSTGPMATSAATPDSNSRLSGGPELDQQRQTIAAAVDGAPTPGGSTTGSHTPAPAPQVPSTSMAASVGPPGGMPPGGVPSGAPFYGQPAPMYPNGPGRPGPPGYPGYPPQGYHPGAPPGHPGAPPGGPGGPPHYPSAQHPASHPSHPQHQQYLQQQHQMWQQQRGYPPQPGMPPPHAQMAPQPARYGYPPRMAPPHPVVPPQSAPSPGNKMRPFPAQPQAYAPSTPQQQPPSSQMQTPQHPAAHTRGGTQPTPATAATPYPPPVQSTLSASSGSSGVSSVYQHHQQPPFPHGSVEASTISNKRRRKMLARDLINATPRRLIMALRSGLEAEAVWAINALNVLLYDDNNPHPSLNQMPGLLNVVVEHFWATLSVLFPQTFKLDSPVRMIGPSGEATSLRLLSLPNGSARQEVKQLITIRNADLKKNNNYTKVSRTGRKVQLKEAEIPERLQRILMAAETENIEDVTLTSEYVAERVRIGLGGGLAERVAARLQQEWDAANNQSRPKFSTYETSEDEATASVSNTSIVKEESNEELEKNKDEIPQILLIRRGRKEELCDGLNDFEMKCPRGTALTNKDETIQRLTQRALSLSNILRGFSFLPGSEQLLCKHDGLLFMIGRFLRLLAEEGPVTRAKPAPKQDVDAPLPEPETYEVMRSKALSMLDCDDSQQLQLLEMVNILRDDAFVMLCHMSVSLDLYEVSSELSYPIYDGLLHWCSSSVPEATDPMPPAAISPRNYSLEILCKMSVLEQNVDMILATGAWPRIEKLIKILTKMLSMSEEIHNREFAIVILNALCNASEAVCYVAALESNAIAHLIAFIETSDQSMHQVLQSHGMTALRDNPEMMGTSVGMLRRAAAMLRLLIKVPDAYHVYSKQQQRLLQFTMSQLMDSRVAGIIADTLYEIQQAADREKPASSADGNNSTTNEDGEKSDVAVKRESVNECNSEGNSRSSSSMRSPTLTSDKETAVKEEEEDEEDAAPAINGDAHKKKRSAASRNESSQSPPSKKSCLENGYEKKNGKIEKSPLKLKESRNENGSMTAVA